MYGLTSSLLMVRPFRFRMNAETAATNAFQSALGRESPEKIAAKARAEFEAVVYELKRHQLDVHVFDENPNDDTPDALFPNNWISFHEGGLVVLYPMQAVSRRRERRKDIVEWFQKNRGYSRVLDLSFYESRGLFLEGTGSVVFDHGARIAYGCASPRTSREVFDEVCRELNYRGLLFQAYDKQGQAIYHTNVMMSLGQSTAVICSEAIVDLQERATVIEQLKAAQKEIIDVSYSQMTQFACNILQIKNSAGELLWLGSASAKQAFKNAQLERLGRDSTFVSSAIPTIEACGGGSLRCMLAEVPVLPGE